MALRLVFPKPITYRTLTTKAQLGTIVSTVLTMGHHLFQGQEPELMMKQMNA